MNNYIQNRYDFVFLFDVKDGNPNGDPEMDNQPRIDFETREGLVSDVCIKRKVRNYVQLKVEEGKLEASKYDIFISQGKPLNAKIKEGKEKAKGDEEKGRIVMCERYYDIRTFGAVLSTGEKDESGKKGVGAVRGPVQFVFSRSIDAIDSKTHSLTRCCKVDDADSTTFGNKSTVSYGLYRMHGYVSAFDGIKCHFTEKDLDLLWDALMNAFEHDHSAARGEMNARALIIFKHDSKLGEARSSELFKLVEIEKVKDENGETIQFPRQFEDYMVTINGKELSPIEDYTKIQDGIAMKVLI